MGNLTEGQSEVIEEAILQVVDEAMDPHLLPILPGLLDDGDSG